MNTDKVLEFVKNYDLEEFYLKPSCLIVPTEVKKIVDTVFANCLHNTFSTGICTFFNLIYEAKRVSIHVDHMGFDNPQARVFISEKRGNEQMIKCSNMFELMEVLIVLKEEE